MAGDGKWFDLATTVGATEAGSRRGALRLAAGGVLAALLSRLGLGEIAARRPKRNPKRRRRCRKQGKGCGGRRKCCSKRCCLDVGEPQGGARFCAESGSICCTAEEGGGACDAGGDCCPPTVADPEGFCCVAGFVCCGDACCPALAGSEAAGSGRTAKRGRAG